MVDSASTGVLTNAEPAMAVAGEAASIHYASAAIAEVRRGQRVRLTGTVSRVFDRAEFRLADDSASIRVTLPWAGPALVNELDRVVVEGIVDDEVSFGLPRPEVVASRLHLPCNTQIIFAPSSSESDRSEAKPVESDIPEGVTPIGDLRRGQSATIRGRVTRMLDTDEFRLEDESGSVRVYIGWRNRLNAPIGSLLMVTGRLDDDLSPAMPEFYASSFQIVGEPRQVVEAEPAPAPAAAPGTPRERTPIGSIRPYDVVLIQGEVTRITDTDEFRIADDSGSVRVYIGWRNQMPVQSGDRVAVVGIVDSEGPGGLFREVYAYTITTPDGRVVQLQTNRLAEAQPAPAPRDPAPAPRQPAPNNASDQNITITPTSQVRRGQSVAVRGVVDRIRDTDEFVLRDDSGTIRIYIGWRNRMPVASGDRVTVIGVADDDVFPGFRPEIYASRIVLPSGQTVTLTRGSYDDYE
jgi:uncharacterized protein YdeI (BOF family)